MHLDCRICSLHIDNNQQLTVHLRLKHSISTKEYYDMFNAPGECEYCGNITAYINFTKGYRRYCSKKCATLATLDSRKQTCLEKYGVENVFQSTEIKNKIYETKETKYGDPYFTNKSKSIETLQERYGIDNPAKLPDFNEKRTQTSLKRYGTNNPMQSETVKLNRKENNNLKYGTDYYWQTDEFKTKTKDINIMKYDAEYYSMSEEFKENNRFKTVTNYNNLIKTGRVTDINNNIVKYHCDICNIDSELNIQTFSGRLYEKMLNPCIVCCPLHKPYSSKEKAVLDMIKTLYSGIIIENDRIALNGKELDIYLPDLKLAFEFDGTYWHADPRFYIATDIIRNKYATTIWEKDYVKDQLCILKDIKLIRIKEYDWKNDNENIKTMILKTINNMIKIKKDI